ncbi:MAG: ribonuclease III domain-containing protein [Clostridia bacterium]|nr:ribonuclease III domain-containing protein [Clostridia bacterium]
MKKMSPLTLAFIGDSIYELMIREYIVGKGNAPVKKLSSEKVTYVCCEFQAKAAAKLMDMFTEEERDFYNRGRNAHVGHVPKNSTAADYHAATALECLFGYLYLTGKTDRLKDFFNIIIEM